MRLAELALGDVFSPTAVFETKMIDLAELHPTQRYLVVGYSRERMSGSFMYRLNIIQLPDGVPALLMVNAFANIWLRTRPVPGVPEGDSLFHENFEVVQHGRWLQAFVPT
jgi:hypothetical protein